MKFEELKPQELKNIIETTGIVYLPLGTLEWHERHLPLGLDSLVAYDLCLKACDKTGGCVMPALYFGTDREHEIGDKILHGIDAKVGKVLTGSVYFLKPDLFLSLLKQIVENLSEQGFKKLVIVSAHSGSAQQEVLEKLEKEYSGEMQLIVLPGKQFEGGIDHAGEKETGLMMAVNKGFVDLKALEAPYEGIFGEDPQNANIEKGQVHLKKIVEQIVAIVEKISI